MFNDLLSSAKGPGVIGLGLGLVVLIGFGSLAFLVLEDKSGGKGIYGQIKDKEKHINLLSGKEQRWNETIEEYSAKREVASKLAAAKSKLKSQQSLVATAEKEVGKMNDEISTTTQKFEDYKSSYRLAERARAVGEKLPTLTIKNGKTYEDVVIRRVFSEGVDIRHKNGGTLIILKLLPDEFLDRFQFSDEDEAIAKKKKDARIAHANKGATAYGKSVKINAIKTKQNSLKSELDKLTRSVAESQRAIALNKAAAERALKKASDFHMKESAARAAGRSTMNRALAKREEAKAANFNRKAANLAKLINTHNREAEQLRRQMAKMDKEIREIKSKQK